MTQRDKDKLLQCAKCQTGRGWFTQCDDCQSKAAPVPALPIIKQEQNEDGTHERRIQPLRGARVRTLVRSAALPSKDEFDASDGPPPRYFDPSKKKRSGRPH